MSFQRLHSVNRDTHRRINNSLNFSNNNCDREKKTRFMQRKTKNNNYSARNQLIVHQKNYIKKIDNSLSFLYKIFL